MDGIKNINIIGLKYNSQILLTGFTAEHHGIKTNHHDVIFEKAKGIFMKQRGLLLVITGNGKGKTTSSLGLALRSIGQGNKVLMIQFLKSSRAYGEIKAAQKLAPQFEIIQVGQDCVYSPDDKKRYQCPACNFACHVNPKNPSKKDRQAAQDGFKLAGEKIRSDQYDMIILDEINYAVDYGMIDVESVLKLIKEKPARLHLVLTGRNATPAVVSQADLVTEMLDIKHPFQKGMTSVKGIDL